MIERLVGFIACCSEAPCRFDSRRSALHDSWYQRRASLAREVRHRTRGHFKRSDSITGGRKGLRHHLRRVQVASHSFAVCSNRGI